MSINIFYNLFIDCPDNCVECMSSSDCIQCDGQTFLLARQCIPGCGKGYYHNKKTRRCESKYCFTNIVKPV